jgi:hypothetical protein
MIVPPMTGSTKTGAATPAIVSITKSAAAKGVL